MKPVKRLFVSPCSDDPLYLEFWTNLMILVLSLYHNYINDYRYTSTVCILLLSSELYKSTLNDPMVSFVESLWRYLSPIYALLNRKILPYILRLIGKKNNPTAMKILCNYLNVFLMGSNTSRLGIDCISQSRHGEPSVSVCVEPRFLQLHWQMDGCCQGWPSCTV